MKTSVVRGKQLWDIWESVRGGFDKIQVHHQLWELCKVNMKTFSDGYVTERWRMRKVVEIVFALEWLR